MKKELLIALFWSLSVWILSFLFGFGSQLIAMMFGSTIPTSVIVGFSYIAIAISMIPAFTLAKVNTNEIATKHLFRIIGMGALLMCIVDLSFVFNGAMTILREQGQSTPHIIGFFTGFCVSRIIVGIVFGWIGVLITKFLQRKKNTAAQINTPSA